MPDKKGVSKEKKGECVAVIQIENISKQYGEQEIFSNFSLFLNDGEKVAIMGESGRGKTTLLRMVACLESPDSGSIRGYAKKDIAYVFQEPRLFDSLSVIKNLTVVSNDSMCVCEKTARELLERVGLEKDFDKYPRELSGGMKQRLALARAFMVDRPILLLDEPFSALDQDTRESMIAFVQERAKDKTILLVTHDLKDARALCKRVEYLV